MLAAWLLLALACSPPPTAPAEPPPPPVESIASQDPPPPPAPPPVPVPPPDPLPPPPRELVLDPSRTGPLRVGVVPEQDQPLPCVCVFERKGRHGTVVAWTMGSGPPEPAVLHVDGRTIHLDPAPESVDRSEFFRSEAERFHTEPLTLRVRTKMTRDDWEEVESVEYEGTMELSAPGRSTFRAAIEGWCGC